ncbi:MAG: serine protein kinase RIO [Candidatus Verstraetearchaeota archaeon]|jgi:RIO kinase 1|nr:serine protein kinase RIO [Candidatus Methanomethylicia archaeon]NHV61188.1 serine protein kinase RIO [Candidatus Verstraetearchaeota archaeon]
MSIKDVEKKLDREMLKKVERKRLKLEKDEDLFETVEEVFDSKTVMALYSLINKGIIDSMKGVVKAGKESRVYWAKGSSEEDLAVKIFLTSSMEFKKSMLQYIHGDPRFSVGKNYRKIVYTWAQKEYRNLSEARIAGVPVPKPICAYQNILVMEFIGEDGVPAPLLKDLPEPDEGLYQQILNAIKNLYLNARLVHADLSEYNIMVYDGKAYLIDFGQAVPREHPMSWEFLKRDVVNILRFFKKAGLNVPEEEAVLEWLKK